MVKNRIINRFSKCMLGLSLSVHCTFAVSQELDIDITAFGDSAFIGGNKLLGNGNNRLIIPHLKGVEVLRSKDINFMNLEATLSEECRKFAEKTFSFVMTPKALGEYLKWGMNFIGLANNHSTDCVDPYPFAYIEPIMTGLQKQYPDTRYHGVAPSVGNLIKNLAVREIRGVSIGMVSIKGWDNGAAFPLANIANRLKIFKSLQAQKHDVRILSLHGGVESTRQPGLVVVEVAREFINQYDGDIVFAHHPHLMQGVEVIKKKNGRHGVIFYSLGNGLHNGLSPKGDGLVAKVLVNKNGVNKNGINVFPLKYASFKPRPFKAQEIKGALAELEDSNNLIPLFKKTSSGNERVPIRFQTISSPAQGGQVVLVE
jgi:hypothetical protein